MQTQYESSTNEQSIDQFLSFVIGNEEYGVDILSVQEIRGWESVTPIPNAPEQVKGVINLRGMIVPIIDLRLFFGVKEVDYTPITVVIVLKVMSDEDERIMGVVVDAVSEVYSIRAHEIKPAPDLGNTVDTSYVQGLAEIDKKMLVLLDLDELLDMQRLGLGRV